MIRIHAAGLLPINVQPEERLYVDVHRITRKSHVGFLRRYNAPELVAANTLKKFDMIRIPLLSGFRRRSVLLKRTWLLRGGPKSKHVSLRITEDALRVCGSYLAEGSIRGDGRTVQFTFNRKEVRYASLVKTWADSIGISHSDAFGRGTRIVYLYSKALADWFHLMFGNGAFAKRLPQWLMLASPTEQSMALEYYFRGDGCLWDESRSAFKATSRSITLAKQVQMMLLSNKIVCCLNATQDHGEPRYEMSISGASVVGVAKDWKLRLPKRKHRYNHVQFVDKYAQFPVRRVVEFIEKEEEE